MILQRLVEVARSPLGIKEVPISGFLLLSVDGSFNGFQSVERGVAVPGPYIDPTMSGKPGLGIHRLEHLVGFKYPRPKNEEEEGQEKKCKKKRAQTREFIRECLKRVQTRDPNTSTKGLEALAKFLEAIEKDADSFAKITEEIEAKEIPTAKYAAVLVDEDHWFQREGITRFWGEEGYRLSDGWPKRTRTAKEGTKAITETGSRRAPEGEEITGQCLVCNKERKLARLMGSKLDGFGRDKPQLISFNRAAYVSRGLTQTYNAPICEECADLVPKGWNALANKPDSNKRIEDHRYVFWGDIPLKPWERNDPQQWLDLINSPWTQQHKTEVSVEASKRFHLLGLGAHKSTAYVVAWLDKSRDETTKAIIRWGKWQNLLGEKQSRFYSIEDFTRSLRPRKNRFNPSKLSKYEMSLCRDLYLLSLGQGRCPERVLPRLANRLATEREDLFGARECPYCKPWRCVGAMDRLAFLNICLHLKQNKEVIRMEELGADNQNAFKAGRIFNLIVWAQREAIGRDTGKTVLAGNARLASTRPAAIIGYLVTRLQSIYLPKLRRDKPGMAKMIDREIGELLRESTLPAKNSPEQMGWFWKGFYHRDIENVKKSKEVGQ